MVIYNMTNVSAANDFYETVVAINELSGQLFGIFFLVAIFFIMFFSFKKFEEDTKGVFLTCSIIITSLAILMWGINLLPWYIVIYPVLLVFASIMVYQFTD